MIKAELAKPDQEPVGYVYLETDYLSQDKHLVGAIDDQMLAVGTPLYAAPVDCKCASLTRWYTKLPKDKS